jgi:hypothetical protein
MGAGKNEERAATVHHGRPRQERCRACPQRLGGAEGGAGTAGTQIQE